MKKSIKVSCALTLYNPKKETFENIVQYSEIFSKVYIFDNSEKESKLKNQKELKNIRLLNNVIYITENNNRGLPYAFNKILELCKDDFLCTLDQDSIFSNNEINSLIEYINRQNKEFALIGPKIIYNNEYFNKTDKLVKKRYIITSGSFININILKTNNIKYDENYFIDKFEIDLCQQLKKAGYKIYEYQNSILFQRLGEPSGYKHPNHAIIRHYYLFRNRFYFNNKFFSLPKKYVLNILQTIRHLLLIILYENQKKKKILTIFDALLDYKKNCMGSKK